MVRKADSPQLRIYRGDELEVGYADGLPLPQQCEQQSAPRRSAVHHYVGHRRVGLLVPLDDWKLLREYAAGCGVPLSDVFRQFLELLLDELRCGGDPLRGPP